MYYPEEIHRFQETRHRENMRLAAIEAKKEFWSGFAWATVMHWCAVALVVIILAPAIRQTIEYAGQVSVMDVKK